MGASKLWLNDYAREHVNLLPANVRSKILSFNYDTDNNVGNEAQQFSNCFTMRDKVSDLANELCFILKYFWEFNIDLSRSIKSEFMNKLNEILNTIQDESVDDQNNVHQLLIEVGYPHKIIMEILREPLTTSFHILFGMKFAITRLMVLRGREKNKLEMRSCGEYSKILSTQLHLYRLITCSFITMHGCTHWETIISTFKSSCLIHSISPMIRSTREMQNKKLNKRIKVLHDNGDISIDSFFFPKRLWSNLIPLLYEQLHNKFKHIFDINMMEIFFDSDCDVSIKGNQRMNGTNDNQSTTNSGVRNNIDVNDDCMFLFWIDSKDTHSSKVLKVNDESNNIDYIVECISALVTISLQGTGLGAPRLSEILRIEKHQTKFVNKYFYYTTQSRKRPTVSSTNTKHVQHKLPIELSKVMMLYNYLLKLLNRKSLYFVSLDEIDDDSFGNNSSYAPVKKAFLDLFNMEIPDIDSLVMRHLYISINDYIFCKDESIYENSIQIDEGIANMSGHSQRTHTQYYSTSDTSNIENNYTKIHISMGASNHLINSQAMEVRTISKRIAKSTIIQAIQIYFNDDNAKFLSTHQANLLIDATNNNIQHTLAILGCGAGKSLSWKIPLIAKKLDNVISKTVIIIIPYCFLLDFHVSNTKSSLGLIGIFNIIGIKGSDIKENEIPLFMDDSINDNRFDLLFMSIEAIHTIMTFHYLHFKRWIDNNNIDKVIVDEVHVLISEISFRQSFTSIRKLSCLRVPVLFMSGSIPKTFIDRLGNYLIQQDSRVNEKCFTSNHKVITDQKLFGEVLVSIEVKLVDKGHIGSSCQYAIRKSRNSDTNIHMICSTIQEGKECFRLIEKHESSVSFIYSGSNNHEEVAFKWKNNQIRILISTTIGIVGNECANTHTVIIVGVLYDLLSIIQAMGRIRPHRRNTSSKLFIFIPKQSTHILRQRKDNEIMRKNQLIAIGLIKQSDEVYYNNCLTSESVIKWCSNTSVCRITTLGNSIGHNFSWCNVCDVCTKSPIALTARVAERSLMLDNSMKQKAAMVLEGLKQKCLVCGNSRCEGGCNVIAGRCYKCYGNHVTKFCNKKHLGILKDRGCYNCYCLFTTRGKTHTFKWCCDTKNKGYKERIRTLLFERYKTVCNTISFFDFMQDIYASDTNYDVFLSSFHHPQTT